MPREDAGHAACVQAWLEAAEGLDAAQLAGRFEQALEGLWRRALQTLGEITLTAIVDRVLYTAAERYPLLSRLRVEGAQLCKVPPPEGTRKTEARQGPPVAQRHEREDAKS